MEHVNLHEVTVEHLQAELQRYRGWVNDLLSGMYVNCVYCGHRYGPGESTPATMADALKVHIAQCPHHPMSKLLNAALGAEHLFGILLERPNAMLPNLILQAQREALLDAITAAKPAGLPRGQ
jgi:hypothetical protein